MGLVDKTVLILGLRTKYLILLKKYLPAFADKYYPAKKLFV